MTTNMKRPTVNATIINEAAIAVSLRTNIDAAAIAKVYEQYMDGFALGRALQDRYHYDITAADVEALDAMGFLVEKTLLAAEEEWVKREGIVPKLDIGTKIGDGVIAGVSTMLPARYKVKETNCTTAGKYLLVKFEVAEDEVLYNSSTI